MYFIILYKRYKLFKLRLYYNNIASNAANTNEERSKSMKNKKHLMVQVLGLFLISLSKIIATTASMGYIGEPDVPKSLLD